jgi:hypothetical protein
VSRVPDRTLREIIAALRKGFEDPAVRLVYAIHHDGFGNYYASRNYRDGSSAMLNESLIASLKPSRRSAMDAAKRYHKAFNAEEPFIVV